jgi:hypothetical protein
MPGMTSPLESIARAKSAAAAAHVRLLFTQKLYLGFVLKRIAETRRGESRKYRDEQITEKSSLIIDATRVSLRNVPTDVF